MKSPPYQTISTYNSPLKDDGTSKLPPLIEEVLEGVELLEDIDRWVVVTETLLLF